MGSHTDFPSPTTLGVGAGFGLEPNKSTFNLLDSEPCRSRFAALSVHGRSPPRPNTGCDGYRPVRSGAGAPSFLYRAFHSDYVSTGALTGGRA